MHEPSIPSPYPEGVKVASRTNPWLAFLAFGIPVLFLVAGAVDAIGASKILDMGLTLILLGAWAVLGLVLTVFRASRRAGLWILAGAVAGAILCPAVATATLTIGLDKAFGR